MSNLRAADHIVAQCLLKFFSYIFIAASQVSQNCASRKSSGKKYFFDENWETGEDLHFFRDRYFFETKIEKRGSDLK